jgi:hypothetical protein
MDPSGTDLYRPPPTAASVGTGFSLAGRPGDRRPPELMIMIDTGTTAWNRWVGTEITTRTGLTLHVLHAWPTVGVGDAIEGTDRLGTMRKVHAADVATVRAYAHV